MLNKKALSATAQVEKDGDFKNTVLLLHGDGTNGAQNNTFTDSSTNAFTITRNGNTTQGTFSPFSQAAGYWSNYFDGNADYFTLGTVSSFNFMHTSSALFTLEAWVFMSAPDGTGIIFNNNDLTSTKVGCAIGINSSNQIKLYIAMGSGTVVNATSTGTVTFNAWNHIAVTYDQSLSSSNATFYINGVSAGTANKSANSPSENDASYVARVGAYNTGGGDFPGYISNLRITNSIVYSSGFTPSTTPLTAITNTKLLTCQSNRFIDNSTNAFAITVNGDTSVQAFSPFAPTAAYSAATNGGSGYFDGTDDCLDVATTTLNPRTDSFTTEGWFYVTSTSGNRTLVGSTSNSLFYISYLPGTTLLAVGDGTTNTIEVTVSALPYSWNYFAISFDGTTYRAYINGTRVQESTTLLASNSVNLTVGARNSGSFRMLGYLSDVRHVKGSALYTGSTMTVPTAPLSTVSGTEFLLKFQGAGIIDSTAKNVLETVGDAQIDTTTKKFGTGSMKFDGTGDYLVAPASSINSLGSGDFTVEGWFRTASASTLQSIVNIWSSSPTQFQIEINASGNIQCSWAPYSTAAYLITGSTAISANTWYHFAFVRNGSTFTLYLNGTSDGTGTSSATTTNNAPLYIGINNGSSLNRAFNGYIDDLRITKGVARYTANFTAPTKAFADQ